MGNENRVVSPQRTNAEDLLSDVGAVQIKPGEAEKARLRTLAERYAGIAHSPDMRTRKRQWTALRDLHPEQPMILMEVFPVEGFLKDSELTCQNGFLRDVEKSLLCGIKQYNLLGDDIVLETYYRLPWRVLRSDYGVPIVEHHAENSMGYLSNFPIQTPDDLLKLKPRQFYTDRERTLSYKELLDSIFGDILPVRVGNYDTWFPEPGFNPFCGNNAPILTMDLFKLIGNENMIYWPYDDPDAFSEVMEYLMEDRRRFIRFLKDEKLLSPNTDNQFAGPSGYGYVSALPDCGETQTVDPTCCWTWVESQEANFFSPGQFAELFLPYLAEYANQFGLVTYGCCEGLHDRIELIKKAIPKLRTVSVSAWSDPEKMAESLGREYVFCRKPNPTFLSGETADWEGARLDLQKTWDCTKDKAVEFIVRDVYDVAGDISRLPKWVEMAKKVIGI